MVPLRLRPSEVEQSGFQVWHSLPTPSVLLVHTDLYSQSVLKQMTPGFPTIDHNKNTPTAYCSNLPLERHPLSPLSSLCLYSYFPCCVLFNSSSYALIPQSLSPVSRFMFLSRVSRLPSLCGYTVTGAWICFSAFSTTESSLCQREKGLGGRGGGLSGWVHPEGAKRRDGGGRGAEWEESLGCQGVTSLDSTSSSPGNHRTPPSPPHSLPSPLQLVNKTTTQKHLQWIHRVALKCIHYTVQ